MALGYARRRCVRYLSSPIRWDMSDLQVSGRRLHSIKRQMWSFLPYALSHDLDPTRLIERLVSYVPAKIRVEAERRVRKLRCINNWHSLHTTALGINTTHTHYHLEAAHGSESVWAWHELGIKVSCEALIEQPLTSMLFRHVMVGETWGGSLHLLYRNITRAWVFEKRGVAVNRCCKRQLS